eukprot:421087-Hanusia_phi.AAC.1
MMRNVVKKFVRKNTELKYTDQAVDEIQLYHNVYNNFGWQLNAVSQLPAEGSKSNQRDGNRIMLSGIRMKCMFLMKGDRPNVTFRVVVVKVPQGYTTNAYNSVFDAQTNNVTTQQGVRGTRTQ